MPKGRRDAERLAPALAWLRSKPQRGRIELGQLHFPSDSGAIAQLGERLAGSQKVVGSSPTSSIFVAVRKLNAEDEREGFIDGLQLGCVEAPC